jgi:putative hydrolase of the HAD superfamily
MIEAILLDAGGVLILPDELAVASALAAVGVQIDRSLLARAHYAGIHAVDEDATTEVDWKAYNRAYVRELGITGSLAEAAREALDRAFIGMDWIVVVESSLRALSALASRGLGLAIVSNSDGTVERVLRETRLAQVGLGEGAEVVAVVDSHHVGVEKPDPRIFEIALEKIGVAADRAIHVGDSVRFDVAGSRAAGVRPVHLDPYGFCSLDDHEHITSLAEVMQLT